VIHENTKGVVVERKDGKARMVLEITIFGQGAIVEIDADLLESIDELKKVDKQANVEAHWR
jgi:transcription antitermination factor NusG